MTILIYNSKSIRNVKQVIGSSMRCGAGLNSVILHILHIFTKLGASPDSPTFTPDPRLFGSLVFGSLVAAPDLVEPVSNGLQSHDNGQCSVPGHLLCYDFDPLEATIHAG